MVNKNKQTARLPLWEDTFCHRAKICGSHLVAEGHLNSSQQISTIQQLKKPVFDLLSTPKHLLNRTNVDQHLPIFACYGQPSSRSGQRSAVWSYGTAAGRAITVHSASGVRSPIMLFFLLKRSFKWWWSLLVSSDFWGYITISISYIYSHFTRELYLYVLAMHVSNDNLIVNRHQHIHTLLRDCTCLYTSYINHVPRIVIWIVLEKTSTAPPFHSLHRRSFVEPTEIQSNCWLPHGMSGSQQLKVPAVGHFDFEADVVSSKKKL